jgi:hypothetical protein
MLSDCKRCNRWIWWVFNLTAAISGWRTRSGPGLILSTGGIFDKSIAFAK